jgi:pilus assembly protein TadC
VNLLVDCAGALAGLGIFLAVSQLVPGAPRLDVAMARIHDGGDVYAESRGFTAAARSLTTMAPWLPVPVADLELLGKDRGRWLASKVACALAGLGGIPVLSAVLLLCGVRLPWTLPAVASLALSAGLFFAPDLVVRADARQKRTDFRHALTSYLDLVALERGAGAGPTEALEAAAQIGAGWAFLRIAAALTAARQASRPPWEGLADLAGQIGIGELADLADIAEVAGQEGARILQTLAARAESMRSEALAAAQAKAGSRSTTMVVPIALLGVGFLLLLIFPVVYRTFG